MTNPGQELVGQNQYAGMTTGLEDLTVDDLKLARLSIDHKDGVFKDSLSGAVSDKISVITLGLVKQRVLWPASVEDDTAPMCKSSDNEHGTPTTWLKPNENFPWAAAGWQPTDFPADTDGRFSLPCGSCRLTQWKTHPDGKKPWCGTQHAVPMLYAPYGEDPTSVAVFTFQRSSIPASQSFFAGIAQRRLPAFAVKASISLTKMTRGKNDYYVPTLKTEGLTDQENWPEYSQQYVSMREFLARPPLARDANGDVIVSSIQESNTIQAVNIGGFAGTTWTPGSEAGSVATPVEVPVSQPVAQVAQPAVQQPVASLAMPATVVPGVPANNDDLPF